VPIWAWVLVTVVAALTSGLLGTLARIRHDRGAERRQRAIDAIEVFGGSATLWFDAVQRAIDDRHQAGFAFDPPQEAMQAAEAAVQDARSKANRLQVLVPWQSEIGVAASEVVVGLQASIDELREWPPQIEDDDAPADEAQALEDDEQDGDDEYDAWGQLIEATIAESMLWHEAGIAAFRKFTRLAAEDLNRPPLWALPRGWRRAGTS
jgi:hypothetical protein